MSFHVLPQPTQHALTTSGSCAYLLSAASASRRLCS
eukprot:CAMPEP_0180002736 /NCGR_PEP_ID=MMETSP0984-20121128/11108_1 /TAXON_ID=483367 /ORGANISM="non described non described, Strain CCMP 2436" /LENGTH=35 /DNA_ID= /DNA_START= /DNA_END= /DNA_ORIENTATION=